MNADTSRPDAADVPAPKSHGARLGDRSLFAGLQPRAYLAHSAISPPSAPVQNAMRAIIEDNGRRGMGAHGTWLADRAALRGTLARLIGAHANDIAFVPNTSAGVLAIALCLSWRAGDRVVLLRGEFPANVVAWQQAAHRHDLRIVWLDAADFDAGGAGLDKLEAELRIGVRLVAVSAVQFQTGLRMPVAAIGALCRSHGTELFIDAIQGLGVVPLDVLSMGIDYLSCGGHKWLMGPEGTGFLYAAPERAAALNPVVAGWLGSEEPFDFLFGGVPMLRYDKPLRRDITIVEAGMPNTVGLAGLHVAVQVLEQLGIHRIFEHVQAYLDTLEPQLLDRGFVSARSAHTEGRSGILSVRHPRLPTLDAAGALTDAGIVVSTPDGWLRFAPHWPNSMAEVPALIDALDGALVGRL